MYIFFGYLQGYLSDAEGKACMRMKVIIFIVAILISAICVFCTPLLLNGAVGLFFLFKNFTGWSIGVISALVQLLAILMISAAAVLRGRRKKSKPLT